MVLIRGGHGLYSRTVVQADAEGMRVSLYDAADLNERTVRVREIETGNAEQAGWFLFCSCFPGSQASKCLVSTWKLRPSLGGFASLRPSCV